MRLRCSGPCTDAVLVEVLPFVSLEVSLDRFCIAFNLGTTDRSRSPSGIEYPLKGPTFNSGTG